MHIKTERGVLNLKHEAYSPGTQSIKVFTNEVFLRNVNVDISYWGRQSIYVLPLIRLIP